MSKVTMYQDTKGVLHKTEADCELANKDYVVQSTKSMLRGYAKDLHNSFKRCCFYESEHKIARFDDFLTLLESKEDSQVWKRFMGLKKQYIELNTKE